MSPKHIIKRRNIDDTQDRLVSAVGEILVNQGPAMLTTAEIARVAGVDKKMVNYHFNSLQGLLKYYLHEKDFWMNTFDKYQPSDNPKEFLYKVFLGQLDLFLHDREMQAIVRWQLTGFNAAINAALEVRNAEAKRLLLKLCKAPSGTHEINLHLLIALISGGIYALVLQEESGNVPLLDINICDTERQDQVKKLIFQLLHWAWPN